jgi:membrane-associated phospholipid phosphatase
MKKLALGVLTCFAILQGSSAAQAQEPKRLQWNEDWPRFRDIGYVLTGASVASALAVTLFVSYPADPRWQGGILFDDAVRTSIRVRDPNRRDFIRRASDVTLFTTILHIGIVDSLIVPLAERSSDVALQLTLMNMQAFSLNTLFATLLFKTAARERPLVQDCLEKAGYSDPLCDSGQYVSFPSSHTSTAFTAAGLSCVHHQFLPLYGAGWDGVACATALTLASATGLFRVIGDRHFATDVMFGAAAGFSLGYIYPWLFHYRYGAEDREPSGAKSALRWAIIPGGTAEAPYGLSIAGGF